MASKKNPKDLSLNPPHSSNDLNEDPARDHQSINTPDSPRHHSSQSPQNGQSDSQTQSLAQGQPGPSVMNKQLLSKLNKSLKEKQKVIQSKDPHATAKNPALIQDILAATLPQLQNFPDSDHQLPKAKPPSKARQSSKAQESSLHNNDGSASPPPPVPAAPQVPKPEKQKTKKRVTKQNSTRTDFFAAKLASAVDDVSSSDSDETFVYENNDNDDHTRSHDRAPAAPSGAENAGPAVLSTEDRGVMSGPQLQNINIAPQSISMVNDNISAPGSVRNNTPMDHAPSNSHTEPESLPPPPQSEEAAQNQIQNHQLGHNHTNSQSHPADESHPSESVHSLQSSKWNLRSTVGNVQSNQNTTPPSQANNIRSSASQLNPIHAYENYHHHTGSGDSHLFANPYMDHRIREPSLKGRRKSSSHSLLPYDFVQRGNRSPVSQYAPSNPNIGSNNHLPPPASISEGPAPRYYYDDDDDIMTDDVSYQGDVNLICTEDNTTANNTLNQVNLLPNDQKTTTTTASGRNKTSTTSSKLRSTNSKLFDKRGAQPRRYSIIPDDVDIEDFDDELIYYDNNNIRFPYNSQNGSHLNESSILLGNSHKLPHYRSLNLASINPRQKQYLKNKRYASLGYNPAVAKDPNNDEMIDPENPLKKVLQFPYQDQIKAYYDLDEFDEESNIESPEDTHAKSLFPGNNGRANKLSPRNTHFLLPRKVSDENLQNSHVRCFKSFVYTMISILAILGVGFVAGFLLASTKDLANLSVVSIENTLVSQDELVFSVVVEALNPSWFTVTIEDAEIDIFAKSGYLKDDPLAQVGSKIKSVETVLLGTVSSLESTLSFDGSFFTRNFQQQTGDIKLVAPGRNLTGNSDHTEFHVNPVFVGTSEESDPPDNSEKWEIISKHPFDLILRGAFKYKLPFSNNKKSAAINKVGYIDPSNSEVAIGTGDGLL